MDLVDASSRRCTRGNARKDDAQHARLPLESKHSTASGTTPASPPALPSDLGGLGGRTGRGRSGSSGRRGARGLGAAPGSSPSPRATCGMAVGTRGAQWGHQGALAPLVPAHCSRGIQTVHKQTHRATAAVCRMLQWPSWLTATLERKVSPCGPVNHVSRDPAAGGEGGRAARNALSRGAAWQHRRPGEASVQELCSGRSQAAACATTGCTKSNQLQCHNWLHQI